VSEVDVTGQVLSTFTDVLLPWHLSLDNTCWLLTSGIIAFYYWASNYSYNASSLTQSLKSSCRDHRNYVTTSSQQNST